MGSRVLGDARLSSSHPTAIGGDPCTGQGHAAHTLLCTTQLEHSRTISIFNIVAYIRSD